MLIRLVVILSILFVSNTLSAQITINIRGKIVDKNTNQAVAYAHIGIPEKGIGTTSGADGHFEFKVPEAYLHASLHVSFIGYKTYKKVVHKIKNPLTVFLEPSTANLTEVVVMDQNQIVDIIRKAVKNIPNNYPTQPTSALGFYRESRTDDSLRYIYLAEGVLNINKKSYRSSKEGDVSLVQGRKINLKNPLDTLSFSGFSSGHMAGHRFDIVQNREDFIKESYFPYYNYWIENITYYNDRPVYIIAFNKNNNKTVHSDADSDKNSSGNSFNLLGLLGGKKKKEIKKGRMKGRIYIDTSSYAFVRAEFEILPEGLKKYNDYPLYAGNWNANSYVVNYRQVGDTWYFSDAFRHGEYGSGGIYNNEIKITEINTEKAKLIPYQDRMQRGDQFVRMTGEYDANFWKDYNTTPLSKELESSVQQMENKKKATEVFDIEYMALLQRKRDSIRIAQTEKNIDDIPLAEMGEPGTIPTNKKKKFVRVRTNFGLGTHFIQTNAQDLFINYHATEANPIFSISDEISKQNFEIISTFDFDFFLMKNFFIRLGSSSDFYTSIYKERSLGLGAELNLFKKRRPFYIRTIAQVSQFKYARKVGQIDNEYGKFEFGKKNFNSKRLNVLYGSRTFNLKASAELAIEVRRHTELFIRGTYIVPFDRRQDVWLFERGQVFRKKESIPADDERLDIFQNDLPFNSAIIPDATFSITVGISFK